MRIVFIFAEGMIGIVCSSAFENVSDLNLMKYTIFFSMFILLSIRLRYEEHMNMSIYFFIVLYVSQNFLVNLIDLLVFKSGIKSGYYHDFDFLKSFSYKIFQAFICLQFSFLYGQSFKPSLLNIKTAPQVLSFM